VAGLGEVGGPLLNILKSVYHTAGVDISPVDVPGPSSVLHVCYPFQLPDFVGTTVAYIEKYKPQMVIVNSTVGVGTTRAIQERVVVPVVYSPVRGKHAKMEQDMLRYQKFVVGESTSATERAAEHFARAGFKVATFPTFESGEVSKLLETTWLGMIVGWAQEIERLARQCGASYDDINAFMKEIDYLPKNVFPGYIGGHCVMPNIAILRKRFTSHFLDAIVESNGCKEKELLVMESEKQ
jgi:UDP-N-acetyl-D-mannosaminuronate dehydrogenase